MSSRPGERSALRELMFYISTRPSKQTTTAAACNASVKLRCATHYNSTTGVGQHVGSNARSGMKTKDNKNPRERK